MANNQRKMTRSMSPGGGRPFHDAALVRGGHNTAVTKRAAKKQVKTREERAWRDESSPDTKEVQP